MQKSIIFLCSTIFLLPFVINGQSKSEEEIKNYYLENIKNLDPIEGIWSIEKCNYTAFYKKQLIGTTQEATSLIGIIYAIIKENSIFKIYSKELNFNHTESYLIRKSLPGNYFLYTDFYEITHIINVVLENSYSMKYSFWMDWQANSKNEMFIAMAKRLNERNTYKFEMEMHYKCAKIFPTYNDYINLNTQKVERKISTGTGFAISSNGYIATNYHVIENSEKISVRGVNGDFSKLINAKVVVVDKNNDLAIIKLDEPDMPSIGIIPYSINNTIIDVGENINVLGFPLTSTMGEEIKYTNGIISSKSGFQGDITTYQCSAPVQSGSSGGPVFDKNGNIVAVINAKHLGTENVSYAIKSIYLLNLIQALPATIKTGTNTISNKPLTEQIKSISKFVYIIEN